MIIFHQIVAAAKSQGVRQLERHAPPTERFTRPDELVDLIVAATSPAAEHSARLLLKKMSERKWELIRGIHTSSADGTPHATIAINKRRYHLRVDAGGSIFDITFFAGEREKPQRLTGREPWLAPGA